MRTLAVTAGDWYWEQDEEYRFTKFASAPGDVRLAGASLHDAIGKRRWELTGVAASDTSWDVHRAVLDGHQAFRDFEFKRTRGDGIPRYYSVSGVPVFDGKGHFVGYQGSSRDISAIKDAEAAEKQARQLLDDRGQYSVGGPSQVGSSVPDAGLEQGCRSTLRDKPRRSLGPHRT
jgi:PAS domain S-box-containing protein